MFSFSLAQSLAIYFRTFSILDSTQKISFVTDSRKYRFSFFISSTPRRSKEKIAEKMVALDFFVAGFDELRWCVLIHFDAKRWAAVFTLSLSPTPPSTWYAKELVSNTNCKWIENTLINHSTVQSEYSSRISFLLLSTMVSSGKKNRETILIFRVKWQHWSGYAMPS